MLYSKAASVLLTVRVSWIGGQFIPLVLCLTHSYVVFESGGLESSSWSEFLLVQLISQLSYSMREA